MRAWRHPLLSSFVTRPPPRTLVALVGGVIAAATISGCSVEVAGVAGVGLDPHGELIGYIQMCDHHIDGATLYRTDDDQLGMWQADEPVIDFASWSLSEPGRGWSAERRYSAPMGGDEYSLYGWTTDNSWSAGHVTFRLRDLDGMQPGEVLHWDGELTVATESEFRANACEGN
jgi:hypothetical protein